MKTFTPTLIDAVKGELLESPLWSVAEQALYLVDIAQRLLLRYAPSTGTLNQWSMPGDPGALALRSGGGVLITLRSGLFGFDPDTEALEPLWPADYDITTTRFNDGRCDRQGRFWVGTIYEPRDRAGAALYCFDRKGLRRKLAGVTVANGLAFSPDGCTAYLADTPTRLVWAFDLDPVSGELSRRRTFIDFEAQGLSGRPDGATVDREGCYWLAMIDAGCIARFDPQGQWMQSIELPFSWPTMPCFGGPELQTMYVTSLRTGRKPEQLAASPDAGTLAAIEMDVRGLAEARLLF